MNAVVRLREWIFRRVNGEEGIPVPGPLVGAEDFERVYADPAADGRSRGAGLSDLFWYWLAPGPQMHQEHLEPGERYKTVARTTRQVLAIPHDRSEALATAAAQRALPNSRVQFVRLRDLMMPIWAEVYYELVFDEPCPPSARDLIVANADDVVTALKGLSLRHMSRRERLTRYLLDRIDAGTCPVVLPPPFTAQETAWYLQGAFFNTAVVQMSEAMAHVLMLAPFCTDISDAGLDRLIDETLRVHPLFGIAHRITSAPITVSPAVTLPAGSVLLFNYLAYQRTGPAPDDDFDPSRWLTLKRKDAHFIPFGVTANRACPARGSAPVMMRAVARVVLTSYRVATSAAHTRSLPNRGPAFLYRGVSPSRRLVALRYADRVADVVRSLKQLVLGTWMVVDARRQKLCATYFEEVSP
ncbi:cytochrome P450 [Actinoplanes sp. NPDC051494]|uniref:cytochrome P450 n=1 Tax=Actinoplanes sp. NPDC051494 TaxID=3363907 RepID=UPI0037BBEA97